MAQRFQKTLTSPIEAIKGIKGRRRSKDKASREAWRPEGRGTTRKEDYKTTRLHGNKSQATGPE